MKPHLGPIQSNAGISVVSPKNCPVEGLPDLSDNAVYASTLDTFTSELGKRFVPHENDSSSSPSMTSFRCDSFTGAPKSRFPATVRWGYRAASWRASATRR